MIEGMIFHHIGVAVKSIEATAVVYENGGYRKSIITFDPIQNVNICWLTKVGMPVVELLEPVNEQSPVCKFLEKNGVSPYHTCYIVNCMEEAIAALRKLKYVIVSKPVSAPAIGGCPVAFLFNKNVGLIELVEAPAIITE